MNTLHSQTPINESDDDDDFKKSRPSQTRVKHQILNDYLKAWGGIIIMGTRNKLMKSHQPCELHFVYVDTCSWCGRYTGEQEDHALGVNSVDVPGSPIIGIQALDSLAQMAVAISASAGVSLRIRTNTILVESNSEYFTQLMESLKIFGLANRISTGNSFSALVDGQIAVCNADVNNIAGDVLAYTQSGSKRAFYFIDPYGAKSIPYTLIAPIVHSKWHDAIIYYPWLQISKKAGSLKKTHPTSSEQTQLANIDAMYGGSAWRKVALNATMDNASNGGPGDEDIDAELALSNYYKDALSAHDNDLIVKSIPLQFSDRDRTIYHLYLTTHDSTGALGMNDVLHKGKHQQHVLRWRLKEAKREAKTGQASLFDIEQTIPMPSEAERPSKEDVARKIFDEFKGKIVKYRDIVKFFADDDYLSQELQSGLKELKRKTLAIWQDTSLKNDTRITFK